MLLTNKASDRGLLANGKLELMELTATMIFTKFILSFSNLLY